MTMPSGTADSDMGTVLITGGAGFFGGILKRLLLKKGFDCVSIDIEADEDTHPRLTSVQGDLRDARMLDEICGSREIVAVFHCAAILAHEMNSKRELWSSNVTGTENIAAACARHGIPKVVYLSSNCLWGQDLGRPVTEEDIPDPVEIYGESKQRAEDILLSHPEYHTVVLRCPTIIDEGRLGLLGILFEFIREGRRIWTVGDGKNRYQFIYAGDLADACLKALDHNHSDIFNVGSDNVPSLRDVYEYVIAEAGTTARVAALPKTPMLLAMRLAYLMRISPLGPYHYRMISENFMFDTSKIKRTLQWSPTLDNREMLLRAYDFYLRHRDRPDNDGKQVSAHKRVARMGVIRLLKLIS